MDEPKGKDRSDALTSKSSPGPQRGDAEGRQGSAGRPWGGVIPRPALGGGLCIFIRSSLSFASQEGAAAAASPGGASLSARPRSAAGGGRRLRGWGSPGWVPPCRSPPPGDINLNPLHSWSFLMGHCLLVTGVPGRGPGRSGEAGGGRGLARPRAVQRGGRERGLRAGV